MASEHSVKAEGIRSRLAKMRLLQDLDALDCRIIFVVPARNSGFRQQQITFKDLYLGDTTNISQLDGIGPSAIKHLNRIQIFTVADLRVRMASDASLLTYRRCLERFEDECKEAQLYQKISRIPQYLLVIPDSDHW